MQNNKKIFTVIGFVIAVVAIVVVAKYASPRKVQYVPVVTIEQAVHLANIAQTDGYSLGELPVEGHVVLGTETKDGVTTVYAVSSYGWFAFENGIFTTVSGSFRVPTVITFSQNGQGEYVLQKYQEPQNGTMGVESIKKMFPAQYLDDVFDAEKFNDELVRQQEAQATEYLKSIGRVATVTASYVEKESWTINVEASNQLLGEVYDFPMWLGTIERLEGGKRYVYETAQSKTEDGYDLITYSKRDMDGKVIIEYQYKIVGSEAILQ